MVKLFVKGSIKNKIFLSYLAILICVLIPIGMLNFIWTSYIVRNQSEEACLNSLRNADDLLNDRLSEIGKLASTLANTYWVRKIALMNGSEIDYNRISHVEIDNYLQELAVYSMLNDFIDEIVIYFNEKDIFMYPYAYDNSEWFFSYKYGFADIDQEKWISLLNNSELNKNGQILFPLEVRGYPYKNKKVAVFLKTIPVIEGKPRATLMVLINEEKIKNLIRASMTNYSSSVYVFNNNNEMVTSINSDSGFNRFAEYEYQKGYSGNLPRYLKNNKGDKFFLYHVVAGGEILTWKYIMFIPVQEVMEKVNYIKYVMIAILGILLVLGILFCYRVTIINYSPVKNLVQNIRSNINPVQSTNEECANEYRFIEMCINNMHYEGKIIKREIEKISSIALKDKFLHLIQSEECYIDKELDLSIITDTYNRKLFAVAIFDQNGSQPSMPETFNSESWSGYGIKRGSLTIFIINLDDKDQLEDIVNCLKLFCNDDVTIGVGSICELHNLRHSYNEAHISVNYKMLKGEKGVMYFSDLAISKERLYYYPINFERELIDLVLKKDFNRAWKVLNKQVKNLVNQSNLPLSIDRYLFYKKVSICLGELDEKDMEKLVHQFAKEIREKKTTDEIQECMEMLYKNICNYKKRDTGAEKDRSLIDEILKFIEENYFDEQMSLLYLAKKFNMSPPQMSSFFKEHTRETYHEYISKLRLRIAKSLLAEGKLTIEQISQQVGFGSAITFRRIFKKYENKTPYVYRQMQIEDSGI